MVGCSLYLLAITLRNLHVNNVLVETSEGFDRKLRVKY